MGSYRPFVVTLALAIAGPGLGCSDSRLDPAGLRRARQAALDVPTPQPGPGRRRPPFPKLTPPATPRIPTPPYRLDVRVDPADLALLPPRAAAVITLRPDFPEGLARVLGPTGAAWLARLPLGELWPRIGRGSLAAALGLKPDRALLVSLLATVPTDRTRLTALERRLATLARGRKAPRLPLAEEAVLRIRVVAQVADPAKLRAALRRRVEAARKRGAKHVRLLTGAGARGAFASLAKRGALAVEDRPTGHAQVWSLVDGRLVVDGVISIAGKWTPRRSARALGELLAKPPTGYRPSAYARTVLLASADLALVLHAEDLADAARWLGVRQMLRALVEAKERGELLARGWQIAAGPTMLAAVTPKAFDGAGLRVYLLNPWTQLRLSWHLTPAGKPLLGPLTDAAAAKNLAANGALVARWLKPLAARADGALPPTGPFAPAEVLRRMTEGGLFMYPLALADFWPRLLNRKPVRKRVLRWLRAQVHPERYVRRINVTRQAGVLELAFEGRGSVKRD